MKQLLTSEAITCSTERSNSLSFESVDNLVEWWARLGCAMGREPLHDVVVAAWVESIGWDGITVQVIRDECLRSF